MANSIEILCNTVLNCLAASGYTEKGIRKHETTYRMLLEYARARHAENYTEQLGRQFVADKYEAFWDGKRGNNTGYANQKITHLEKLWHYQEYGTILFSARSGKKPPFSCPKCFSEDYASFLAYCLERDYAPTSKQTLLYRTQKFLMFLDSQGVRTIESVTASNVEAFFTIYADCSPAYLKSLASRLNTFLGFLYAKGMLIEDKRVLIPKFKHVRDVFLPASWGQEEICRLLKTVDRCNAIGKRDYAMLLLVIRLGLRATDVRSLQLGDFDWKKRQLRIIQSKTRNELMLPLPNDVGWAVIDYIRAGRPETTETALFIRHSPGGGPISQTNKLQTILHKYMRRAGIKIPKDEGRGLHSLRSSLARSMLETGVPLPVITEVLGHKSTLSTSHYLRIDMENLSKCPIDPEGVFE